MNRTQRMMVISLLHGMVIGGGMVLLAFLAWGP